MKKIMLVGLLVLIMTGTAWSFSSNYDHATGQFDHVLNSQNMIGDVLIYPIYLADGSGWETKISVINTDNIYSAVAKVVIRGGKYSQELFDFFIYLSPDDMWTATIYNDNGQVKIFSDDDSVRTGSSPDTFGDTVPLDVAFSDPCDENTYGYIEIFNSWTMNRAAMANTDWNTLGADVSAGPIDKQIILDAYKLTQTLSPYVGGRDILTGSYEVKLPSLGLSAMENAVVLEDYDITDALYPFNETFFGQGARNSMAETEAVLAKDTVYMPYYDDGMNVTAHVFTFPTKLTQLDTDCDMVDVLGEFFLDNCSSPDWAVQYGIKAFNLEEESIDDPDYIFSPYPEEQTREFPEEVNISVVGLDSTMNFYDEGWAWFSFQGFSTTGLTEEGAEFITFSGAPVIPLSANLGADGLSLKYGAYDPAEISYEYATQR